MISEADPAREQMNPKDSDFYVPLDEFRAQADRQFAYALEVISAGVAQVPEETTRDVMKITGRQPITEVGEEALVSWE